MSVGSYSAVLTIVLVSTLSLPKVNLTKTRELLNPELSNEI